jgi:hypothetical protein
MRKGLVRSHRGVVELIEEGVVLLLAVGGGEALGLDARVMRYYVAVPRILKLTDPHSCACPYLLLFRPFSLLCF